MAVEILNAQQRGNLGNSALKELRKKGFTPGIFYMNGKSPINISVKDTFLRPFVYTSEVKIINLVIEETGVSHNCILKDLQFDPVSDKPIHFDLLGISEDQKIKIRVPINLQGSPVGVKDGGIIQHTLHKIEIECLPKDIPSHIDVVIDDLKIGDSIRVEDLKHDAFDILETANSTIVAVVAPAVEKVAEGAEGEAAPVEGETAEPEVITKGKKEEEEEK
jgi:large subunit ribosomal protein L25